MKLLCGAYPYKESSHGKAFPTTRLVHCIVCTSVTIHLPPVESENDPIIVGFAIHVLRASH
jgi:hypothetical protein